MSHHQVVEPPQDGCALLRGERDPAGHCGMRGLDRAARFGFAHVGDSADARAGRGIGDGNRPAAVGLHRSEEHTSELQSLMRISYAVFCLKKKKTTTTTYTT